MPRVGHGKRLGLLHQIRSWQTLSAHTSRQISLKPRACYICHHLGRDLTFFRNQNGAQPIVLSRVEAYRTDHLAKHHPGLVLRTVRVVIAATRARKFEYRTWSRRRRVIRLLRQRPKSSSTGNKEDAANQDQR